MIERIYQKILDDHFEKNNQMAFLSGARQVGKTTTSRTIKAKCLYINWDNQADRIAISAGPDNVAEKSGLLDLENKHARIVFDELHKYSKWKNFIKGFYDNFNEDYKIIVTGSARLNIFKRGGDSLMGRYFLYRMHPLTVAELNAPQFQLSEIRKPTKIADDTFKHLLNYSGFPEPFIKSDTRFYNRWKRLRLELFFNEDLRDVTNIQEISQIEILAELLRNQVGQLINLSSLARNINVSVDTIRRWVLTLENMYYCYLIRPWFKNVPKSLRKQPKVYLWDWSTVTDPGARYENLIASHLLKAVHYWTDAGFADYGLYFLRDKTKREVDFLITKNQSPWILIEAKSSGSKAVSPHLKYFHKLLSAEHAFQIISDAPYVELDCFTMKKPVKVPIQTFLSQLV